MQLAVEKVCQDSLQTELLGAEAFAVFTLANVSWHACMHGNAGVSRQCNLLMLQGLAIILRLAIINLLLWD